MNLGNWQIDAISGGTFAIDGGVAFGVVPKTLWSNLMPPDANNRIRLGTNCLLARDGVHTVLVDTGFGDKQAPLDRKFWELEEGNPVVDNLAALGVAPEDIDTVVLSHLHWDHAGGLTRANGSPKSLVPTFRNARHVIGRIEWEDATSRAPELLSAYPQDNLWPLADLARVELIEGQTEICPGLTAQLTGGHTRGHMSLRFSSSGQTALFIGDICATSLHLNPMWNLSYDTFPLVTRQIKPQLLAAAAAGNWWVVWPHEIETVAAKLTRHGKDGFKVVDRRARL
jgi:glyoxylase-like metal-dependent hydrolase (beta-lactamase superfamily II)